MPKPTKEARIAAALTSIRNSVPTVTAFRAQGFSDDEYRELLRDSPQLQSKIDSAEAAALASLISVQHSAALLGEHQQLNNLLSKRFSLDKASSAAIVQRLIDVAEGVLPSEWFIKYLAAIEEEGID